MVQAGNGLGLALKTLPQSCIVGEMRRKNFDCDHTVQARVPRAVHLTHPTRAQRSNDLIRPEFGSCFEHHCFFSGAFQFVRSVNGEAVFDGSELMRKRPSGATSYCQAARAGETMRVWKTKRGALAC